MSDFKSQVISGDVIYQNSNTPHIPLYNHAHTFVASKVGHRLTRTAATVAISKSACSGA